MSLSDLDTKMLHFSRPKDSSANTFGRHDIALARYLEKQRSNRLLASNEKLSWILAYSNMAKFTKYVLGFMPFVKRTKFNLGTIKKIDH